MKELLVGEREPLLLPSSSLNRGADHQGGQSFGRMMIDAVENVNELYGKADQRVEALAKGEDKDIHNTMISMAKADVSFQFMMQVRNKILAAYQEIMRMPV